MQTEAAPALEASGVGGNVLISTPGSSPPLAHPPRSRGNGRGGAEQAVLTRRLTVLFEKDKKRMKFQVCRKDAVRRLSSKEQWAGSQVRVSELGRSLRLPLHGPGNGRPRLQL